MVIPKDAASARSSSPKQQGRMSTTSTRKSGNTGSNTVTHVSPDREDSESVMGPVKLLLPMSRALSQARRTTLHCDIGPPGQICTKREHVAAPITLHISRIVLTTPSLRDLVPKRGESRPRSRDGSRKQIASQIQLSERNKLYPMSSLRHLMWCFQRTRYCHDCARRTLGLQMCS